MAVEIGNDIYVQLRLSLIRNLDDILSQTEESSDVREPFLIPENHCQLYSGSSHKTDDITHYLGFLRNEAKIRDVSFQQVLSERSKEAIRNIVVAYKEPFGIGPENDFSYNIFEKYGGDLALDVIVALDRKDWENAERGFDYLLNTLIYR